SAAMPPEGAASARPPPAGRTLFPEAGAGAESHRSSAARVKSRVARPRGGDMVCSYPSIIDPWGGSRDFVGRAPTASRGLGPDTGSLARMTESPSDARERNSSRNRLAKRRREWIGSSSVAEFALERNHLNGACVRGAGDVDDLQAQPGWKDLRFVGGRLRVD